MIKKCDDSYGYGCSTTVNGTDEEIEKVFRKVKTHTGDYFRGVCRSCEAVKQSKYRVEKKVKGKKYGNPLTSYTVGSGMGGNSFDTD